VLYLFTFLTAREQVQRQAETVSLRQSLGTFRHNPPLLLLCLSSLMFLTGLISLSTVGDDGSRTTGRRTAVQSPGRSRLGG
jgi:glucuronide carrier protein